jgi:AhpC/TSA family
MKRSRTIFSMVAATAALFGALSPCALAQTATSTPTPLRVGQEAPDFKLQYFDGTDLKDVSLSQYRGKKNVIVAFYIFAFTGG